MNHLEGTKHADFSKQTVILWSAAWQGKTSFLVVVEIS